GAGGCVVVGKAPLFRNDPRHRPARTVGERRYSDECTLSEYVLAARIGILLYRSPSAPNERSSPLTRVHPGLSAACVGRSRRRSLSDRASTLSASESTAS